MALKVGFRKPRVLRLPTGKPAFPPIWDTLPALPPVCTQPPGFLLQADLCEQAKGPGLPGNNPFSGPMARGLVILRMPGLARGLIALCDFSGSQRRGLGFATAPFPQP